MWRRKLLPMVAMLVAGCQTVSHSAKPRVAVIPEAESRAVVASALVFDPPVIQDDAPLELSRADREARVSVGYEELTTESFYIRMDDVQSNQSFGIRGSGFGIGGNFDHYERRAVTERVGVRYR